MVVKQYQVMMDADIQTKSFAMGGGATLTIANGTILDEGHELVKKFPSYVVLIGEKLVDDEPAAPVAPESEVIAPEPELLNEDPIADAAPEVIVPEPAAPVAPVVTVKPAAKAEVKPAKK